MDQIGLKFIGQYHGEMLHLQRNFCAVQARLPVGKEVRRMMSGNFLARFAVIGALWRLRVAHLYFQDN